MSSGGRSPPALHALPAHPRRLRKSNGPPGRPWSPRSPGCWSWLPSWSCAGELRTRSPRCATTTI